MRKNNNFNNSYNVIEKIIKEIRKKNNITQEDLCARIQVEGFQISSSDISKLENDKKLIPDFEIIGFSKCLKVSILDLFKNIR